MGKVAVRFDAARDRAWAKWHARLVALLMRIGWRRGNAVTWADLTLQMTPNTGRVPATPGLRRLRLAEDLIREVRSDPRVPRHKRIAEITKRATQRTIALPSTRTIRRRGLLPQKGSTSLGDVVFEVKRVRRRSQRTGKFEARLRAKPKKATG